MLYAADTRKRSTVEGMRGGKGSAHFVFLLQDAERCGGIRLFAQVTLKPGCGVGLHEHHGECEVYHVLAGQGQYTDNASTYAVGPGDVTVCPSGQAHALENTGSEDLSVLALILPEAAQPTA